jgi:hypothetical protein
MKSGLGGERRRNLSEFMREEEQKPKILLIPYQR